MVPELTHSCLCHRRPLYLARPPIPPLSPPLLPARFEDIHHLLAELTAKVPLPEPRQASVRRRRLVRRPDDAKLRCMRFHASLLQGLRYGMEQDGMVWPRRDRSGASLLPGWRQTTTAQGIEAGGEARSERAGLAA